MKLNGNSFLHLVAPGYGEFHQRNSFFTSRYEGAAVHLEHITELNGNYFLHLVAHEPGEFHQGTFLIPSIDIIAGIIWST